MVTHKALLLIDFQRDFLRSDGRMPIARDQIEKVITAANHAVAAARADGDTIIAIGNEFLPTDRLMNFFRRNAAITGSTGAAWDQRVDRDGAAYFPKWRSDAFCNPALETLLKVRDINQVVLTGLYATACVTATAKSALARGYRVDILGDAVADSSDRARKRALDRLASHGANIVKGLH